MDKNEIRTFIVGQTLAGRKSNKILISTFLFHTGEVDPGDDGGSTWVRNGL